MTAGVHLFIWVRYRGWRWRYDSGARTQSTSKHLVLHCQCCDSVAGYKYVYVNLKPEVVNQFLLIFRKPNISRWLPAQKNADKIRLQIFAWFCALLLQLSLYC